MKTVDNLNINDNYKNMHIGHRERLRDNISKNGIYSLDDLHFMEYLLTFVITRNDTNPIAHRLLEKFGGIDEVFDAPLESLMSVEGVGIKTARFIQYMSACAYMYNKSKAMKKPKLDTLKNIVSFLRSIFPPSDNEQLCILVLNKDLSLKTYKIFKGVSHSFISVDINDLTDVLVKDKAKFIVIAHTHPKHNPKPSLEDLNMFDRLKTITIALSINIIDNLILGENSFFSFKAKDFYEYTSKLDIDY